MKLLQKNIQIKKIRSLIILIIHKNQGMIIRHFQIWEKLLNLKTINFCLAKILLIWHSFLVRIFLIFSKKYLDIKYMKIKKKKVCKFQIKLVIQKENEQERTKKLLQDLQEKLQVLNDKKKTFQKFEEQSQQIDDIKQMLFQRKLKILQEKQEELEKNFQENQENLDNKILQKQQIQNNIQKLQLQGNNIDDQQQEQDVDVQDIFENTIFGQDNVQYQNNKIIEGQRNFEKNVKKDKKNAQQVLEIKQEIQILCESANKLMFQRLQIDNQLNMQSFNTLNKNQKEEVIKSNKKQESLIQREIDLIKYQNDEIQKEINTIQENINMQEQITNKFCEGIEKKYKKLNISKEQLNKFMNQQQNLRLQLKKQENSKNILNQTISKKLSQLAKTKGSNNLSLLMVIVEEYQKRKNVGKIDFLINCIDFPKSMNIPIEALFYKDLFTIIVDDEQDAQNLIKMNEQKQGGKIKILPLKWIKENKNLVNTTMINNSFSFQNDQMVKIKDYITLKENCKFSQKKLNILLDQIFGNSVYVKSRENALRIAKDENINAVTQEGEVFYAGAYLGKVGRFQIQNSKVNLFQEISELKNQKIEDQKDDLVKQKEDIENAMKQIQEDISKSQSQISQIELNYNQVKISIKNKQNQLVTLTKQLFNNKNLVALKVENIQNLANYKNQSDKSKQQIDFQKLQKQIQKIDKQILKNNQEQENLKEKLQSLLEYKQKESIKLSQNIKQDKSPKFKRRQYSNESNNTLQKDNKEMELLEKNKNSVKEEIEQLKSYQCEYQGKLQGLTLQILDLKNKINRLQPSQENQFEDQSTKQLMEKLKKLMQKTKNVFSEKDQVAFHKLRDINKKEKDFGNQLNSIEEKKNTLLECFDETVEKRKNNFFQSFKKNFEQIYRNYEPLWKVKVTHTKNKDENNENYDSIEFQLDPRNSESENNLYERKVFNRSSLSMGKKVVFGLCFLQALQKIEKVYQKTKLILLWMKNHLKYIWKYQEQFQKSHKYFILHLNQKF